jgi:hypothetical protein
MKLIYSILAVGIGLILTGPIYIQLTGYDALSVEFWLNSFSVLMTTPNVIFTQAFEGEYSPLFQGILMVAFGFLLVITFVSFKLILPKVFKNKDPILKKIIKKGFAKKEKEVFKDEVFDADIEKKTTAEKIKEKLSKSGSASFGTASSSKSVEIGLDDDEQDDEPKKVSGFIKSFTSKKNNISKEESDEKEIWRDAINDSSPSTVLKTPSKNNSKTKTTRLKLSSKILTPKDPNEPSSGFRASLDSAWDSLVVRLSKNKIEDKAFIERTKDDAKKLSDRKSRLDIMVWYKSVQEGIESKKSLVDWASEISDNMTENDRHNFTEENNMDGAFILRLLESWANRTDFDEAVGDDENDSSVDSKQLLRDAIRAVQREKETGHVPDLNSIPKDFNQDLNLEDNVSENNDSEIIDDVNFSGSDDYVSGKNMEADGDDDEQNLSEEEKTILKIIDVVSEMKVLVNQATLVLDGTDEWPEHLSSEEYRVEEAVRLSEKMSRLTFLLDEDEVYEISSNSEDDVLVWLTENFDIVREGFEEFSKKYLIEISYEDDDVYNSDTFNADDEDDSENVSPDEKISDVESEISSEENTEEKLETESNAIASESNSDEDNELNEEDVSSNVQQDISETNDTGKEVDQEESEDVDPLDAALADISKQRDLQDGNQSEQSEPFEEESSNIEVDTSSDNEENNETTVFIEDSSVEESNTVSDEKVEEDETNNSSLKDEDAKIIVEEIPSAKIEESNEIENNNMPSSEEEDIIMITKEEDVYIPRNVGISDLEEMSVAAKEVMSWGMVSKEAGASGGSMLRLVYNQKESGIEPVGIVHVVMFWKSKPVPNRVNIVFRYLEEGNWKLDENRFGTMVKENGDFVLLKEEMFDNKETSDSVNLIHYHGPGAKNLDYSVPSKIRSNVWVVSNIISGEKVNEMISNSHP